MRLGARRNDRPSVFIDRVSQLARPVVPRTLGTRGEPVCRQPPRTAELTDRVARGAVVAIGAATYDTRATGAMRGESRGRNSTIGGVMFRIKICGITSSDDARAAVAAGADAIGLNFYPRSKRFVSPEVAAQIAAALPDDVIAVGVFVNTAAEEINEVARQVGLDCVQLHGDEPPAFAAQLAPGVLVVRAHRCGVDGLAPLAQYLTACRAAGRVPDAVLVDADAGGDYGGTGEAADWSLVAREKHVLGEVPLVLAGGLTADNVAAAVTAVRPHGVDVASGVESAPGQKDAALVQRFVAAARQALHEQGDRRQETGDREQDSGDGHP